MSLNTSPSCGCKRHEEFVGGQSFVLKKLDQRPAGYYKRDINFLIENGWLSARAKYLCNACNEKARSLNQTAEPSTKKQKLDSVQELIHCIENKGLGEEELINVASALGKSQNEAFRAQANEASSEYKEGLQFYSPCFLQHNKVVLAFVSSLVGLSCSEKKSKKHIPLLAALDCLLAATNSGTVTTLYFALNVIIYFVSGSKSVLNFLASISPAGCYLTVMNWFKEKTAKAVKCDPRNDVISFFDNNQVLARNWRVRYNAKAMISVITSVIHIERNVLSGHQFSANLDPSAWLYRSKLSKVHIVSSIKDFISSCEIKFDQYRNTFILERLNKVFLEHQCDNFVLIDQLLHDESTPIPSFESVKDPYAYLKHGHPETPPSIIVGDPIFENPCSYTAVKNVLEHFLKHLVTDTERKWTIIGCDGLPYLLASRLIEKHDHLQHILLQPGLGHYEINMTKACFKLLWDVCLSDLGKFLGFNSVKAQTACKSANDHHKSWQILTIFFYSCADELLVPYIKNCKEKNYQPSLSGYHDWLNSVKDPNYLFMKHAVFSYLLPLFLFRAAVRRNNNEALIVARSKFSALFYGLNMTCYQEIDYRDLCIRTLAPKEISDYLAQNESFSVSGNPSKGEGGDFVLESKNRRIKMLIPTGLPTKERWLRACRTFDTLDEIRSNMSKVFGIREEDDSQIPQTNLMKEITLWRKRLRSVGYLSHPFENRPHVSLTNQPLEENLKNFSEHCKDSTRPGNIYFFENEREIKGAFLFIVGNRQIYLEDISIGLEPGRRSRLLPIFITRDERDRFRSIENQTKKQLEALIYREIEQIRSLGSEDVAESLLHTWSTKIKCLKKEGMVVFYKTEVCVALDETVESHPLLVGMGKQYLIINHVECHYSKKPAPKAL